MYTQIRSLSAKTIAHAPHFLDGAAPVLSYEAILKLHWLAKIALFLRLFIACASSTLFEYALGGTIKSGEKIINFSRAKRVSR